MRRPALSARGWAAAAALMAVVVAGAWLGSGLLGQRLAVRLDAVSGGAAGFSFAPSPLVVPARTAVALTLVNLTDAPHTLILLEPVGVSTVSPVAPGATARLELITPEPGTYGFVCNVHEGMIGALVVR